MLKKSTAKRLIKDLSSHPAACTQNVPLAYFPKTMLTRYSLNTLYPLDTMERLVVRWMIMLAFTVLVGM